MRAVRTQSYLAPAWDSTRVPGTETGLVATYLNDAGLDVTYLKEAGLDATYCARPSISGRSSLILENRNGSNTPGLGYRDSSIVIACVGIPIVVCAGIVKPEDNVRGL